MLRLVFVSVLLGAGLGAGLVGCSDQRRFSLDDDQAVRAVLLAQRDAWNRGDLEGYMSGYAKTDELVFTSGGNVRHGWQETHDKYQAKYGKNPSTMGHLEFELLQVQPLGADGAIVLGRWVLDGPNSGKGLFSVALARHDGRWEIVHDHTSSG